jgi:chromosome segregation ATPase
VVMKYNKEFKKADGRKLMTGGPRDLQRKQRTQDRQQSELIDFLRDEVQRLNKALATSGSGEYTGEQVDEEIRKAVSVAVAETKIASEEDRKELQSAVDAFKTNEKNLLEQIKNLEIYQLGVKDSVDKLRLEKDKAISDKKELEDELKDARSGAGGLADQLKGNREKRIKAEKEVKNLKAEKDIIETKCFELEESLRDVEHKRVLLENEKINGGVDTLKSELEESQKQRANLQTQLGDMAQNLKDQTVSTEAEDKLKADYNASIASLTAEKDSLNALHNKDMKKFQSEIEFLIKEKTDLTNKHNNEITKFKIESEKKKGEFKSLREKAKQKGVDEEITDLLKEQTKQIEALTEALANAEYQLEIETNRPKMETAFIDPLEKDAGKDLTPHIEIKEEKPEEEKGEMNAKVERLRSLMGKLPTVNG